jgi:hypothetical protein
MPDDVNPFEPWRPPPRPPLSDRELFRDSVHEGDGPIPDRSPTQDSAGSAGKNLLSMATVLLLLGALVAVATLGGAHVTRLAAAGGALWVGLLVALVAGRTWRWLWRLGWLAAGAIAAVACWYCVPTAGGVSLLEARRRLDVLRRLPPGDLAGFTAGNSDRAGLRQEFPTWKSDLDAAEASWVRQTVTQAVAEADRLRERDPELALNHLRQTQAALHGTAHSTQARQDLFHAQQRVVQTLLDRAERDLDDLLRKRQFAAFHQRADETVHRLNPVAAEVGLQTSLSTRIQQLRVRSVRRQADLAGDRLARLLERKDHVAVAKEGRRLWADLREVARPLHQEQYVQRCILPLRAKALEARLQASADELTALYDRGDLEAVAKQGAVAESELRDEAKELDRGRTIASRLAPIREKALLDRLARARKTLDELFTKKEYVAVATRGKQMQDALEEEAKVVGASKKLRATLAPVRQNGLKARLDAARREALALLAKDRYQAVGDAGEKAFKEMAAEAAAIGCTAELERFRDSCKVFADLAKKAEIEDRK